MATSHVLIILIVDTTGGVGGWEGGGTENGIPLGDPPPLNSIFKGVVMTSFFGENMAKLFDATCIAGSLNAIFNKVAT